MLGSQPVADAQGTIAGRPAANTVPSRYVWLSTDINQYSVSDGTNWLDFRACQTVVSGHMESRLKGAPDLRSEVQGYAGVPFDRIELLLEPDSAVLNGGVFRKYTQAFTNVTSVTALGTAHQIGTAALIVQFYTTAGVQFIPDTVTIDQTLFDITATFADSTSGYLVVV